MLIPSVPNQTDSPLLTHRLILHLPYKLCLYAEFGQFFFRSLDESEIKLLHAVIASTKKLDLYGLLFTYVMLI